ncbi:amino acid transporter [Citricoccus sp. SGAir0253]|uniref:LysE/ArgO family amino acid transporter n=1 Tax=Citricoccus sp. SGAir0253 TaxID=2567881 RepID=UPI0010CD4504|nr:LysE family transporter [Citricoccus sp. SGAir0253]QCU79129.1 amino acid transporter [Citricoccus sp. SGAir0253]
MTIFLTGLVTCLALIVAIGAQGLFIMRQALRRDRLALTLAVCLAADLVMVFAGTAGVGVLAERVPWLVPALTWGGVAYLLWFAVGSFRSAFSRSAHSRPGSQGPDAGPLAGAGAVPAMPSAPPAPGVAVGSGAPTATLVRPGRSPRARSRARTVVLTGLSVSVLNPHAILDTMVMIGTLANAYGPGRWAFAAGAVTGSAAWFLTLGLGVRALAPVLDTPRTWRVVDAVIGVVMVGIAARLALG